MQTLLLLSEQQNISVARISGLAKQEPKHRTQIFTKNCKWKFN